MRESVHGADPGCGGLLSRFHCIHLSTISGRTTQLSVHRWLVVTFCIRNRGTRGITDHEQVVWMASFDARGASSAVWNGSTSAHMHPTLDQYLWRSESDATSCRGTSEIAVGG